MARLVAHLWNQGTLGNQWQSINGNRWRSREMARLVAHLWNQGTLGNQWQSMEIKGDGPSGRSQKCAGRARA